MDLDIDAFISPPVAVLRVAGELDLHTAAQVPPAVDDLLERGCSLIGVDLAAVSFIDCSAIEMLLTTFRRVRARPAQLVVYRVSDRVLRVVHLTGTDRDFGFHDTPLGPLPETTEALRALAAGGDTTLGLHLFAIAQRVKPLVPDLVGLSLGVAAEEGGVTLTLVATDEGTAALDAMQYLDGGPCTTAAAEASTVHTSIDDLLDEDRWRLFAQASAEVGVASSLSLPITSEGRVIGGVNLYASTHHAFDGLHDAVAEAVGADAHLAVANADLSFTTREQAMEAPTRLRGSSDINIALGIIAARHDVDIPVARERLRQAAAQAGITEAQAASALRNLRS